MGAIAGQFLNDISARFAAGHRERAVGRSAVSADDRAAGAAGVAGKIADLEHSPFNGLFRVDTIILPHTNGREGAVEDAEGVPLACLNKSLLFAGFCQAEALGRLQFLDSEPAIPQIQFGVLGVIRPSASV